MRCALLRSESIEFDWDNERGFECCQQSRIQWLFTVVNQCDEAQSRHSEIDTSSLSCKRLENAI